jgi:hypothetical protein
MLLVAVICISAICFPQEQSLKKKNVPKAILDAFQASYPKATLKGYSKEKDKETVVYEVESVEGKIHRDVSYTVDGAVISVEESLPYDKVPQPVRDALLKEYPKAKVSMCEKVTKGETIQYELLVRSGKQKYELVFNTDGTIVEKEKK